LHRTHGQVFYGTITQQLCLVHIPYRSTTPLLNGDITRTPLIEVLYESILKEKAANEIIIDHLISFPINKMITINRGSI